MVTNKEEIRKETEDMEKETEEMKTDTEEMKTETDEVKEETEGTQEETEGAEETAEEVSDENVEEPSTETLEEPTAAGGEDEDLKTKYLRLMAEFQNYKKRTAKEKDDIYKFGSEKLAMALLDVMDNFDRALDQSCSDEKFLKGMELIFNQFGEVLHKQGIKEIDALGEDFDPNIHSAVLMEETDEYESGKVCFVVQKGYELNGKVIRPAMVKVAK